MTCYTVHLFREMRLTYAVVEAESPEEAAAVARNLADRQQQPVAEDCDGATFAALVDVDGDEDYEQSRMIDFSPPAG